MIEWWSKLVRRLWLVHFLIGAILATWAGIMIARMPPSAGLAMFWPAAVVAPVFQVLGAPLFWLPFIWQPLDLDAHGVVESDWLATTLNVLYFAALYGVNGWLQASAIATIDRCLLGGWLHQRLG